MEIKLFCFTSKLVEIFCLAAKFICVHFERILVFVFQNMNEIKARIHVSSLAVKKNPGPAEGASLWEEGFIIQGKHYFPFHFQLAHYVNYLKCN